MFKSPSNALDWKKLQGESEKNDSAICSIDSYGSVSVMGFQT